MTQQKQAQDQESQEWGIKGMQWGTTKAEDIPFYQTPAQHQAKDIWHTRNTMNFDRIFHEGNQKRILDYLDQAASENKAGNIGRAEGCLIKAKMIFDYIIKQGGTK